MKNSVQICKSCGARMNLSPDALVQACGVCGDRLTGLQTMPVESLSNICSQCRHPISPEHDDIGCHIDGCPCTMNGAGTIDKIAAALTNSRINPQWFRRPSPEMIERAEGVGIEDFEDEDLTAIGLRAKLAALEEGHGDEDIIASLKKQLGLANADDSAWKDQGDYNADGGCRACGWGAPGTGHSSGYHKENCAILKKERKKFEHLQGAERKNSDPRRDTYKCRACPFTTQDIKVAGQHEDTQDGNDHRIEIIEGDLSKQQRENSDDKGPFDQPNHLGCNYCDDIKAPLNKDGYCRQCAAEQGPRENAASREAFEAHTKECQGCANALESGKLDGLCEAGTKLIEAKNEGGELPCYRCKHAKSDHAGSINKCKAEGCACAMWVPNPNENKNSWVSKDAMAAAGAAQYGSRE